MSSIQEHWDNIARYERLKSQVRRIISELNLAAGRTDSLKSNIERCYQIDGSGAAMASSVVNLQHDIRETANYLSNSVIPGVDSSIDYERREIQRLEEEDL